MSTEPTGDAAIGRTVMKSAQQLVDAARPDEAEQLDLLEPITAEDIWAARDLLGAEAHHSQVTAAAREGKRGRPKGSRNRRTDDLERWLLSHGQHPALTLMQIQSTAPEVLMAASARPKRIGTKTDGTPDMTIERMSYEAAQSLRIRSADILMPYLVGKKPIAVDLNLSGVADLIIQGVTHTDAEVADIVEAEFLPVSTNEQDA